MYFILVKIWIRREVFYKIIGFENYLNVLNCIVGCKYGILILKIFFFCDEEEVKEYIKNN